MKNLVHPAPGSRSTRRCRQNLRAGKPEGGREPTQARSWGPVITTYAGMPEIDAEWVARHREQLQILDVRAPDEFNGEPSGTSTARS